MAYVVAVYLHFIGDSAHYVFGHDAVFAAHFNAVSGHGHVAGKFSPFTALFAFAAGGFIASLSALAFNIAFRLTFFTFNQQWVAFCAKRPGL